MDFRHRKILIVGFGRSGQAALKYLLKKGANLTVNDLRAREGLQKEISPFAKEKVEWIFGGHPVSIFLETDAIVVSPGVPLHLDGLKRAKEAGIPILSEMEIALQEIQRLQRQGVTIIACTGTNGKTTTVTLIHHLLEIAGKKGCLAGNVGIPLLDRLETKAFDYLVLEVSSFQLETTPSLSPKIAVWLNLSPDHIDWHESFSNYASAKARIAHCVKGDGIIIYNKEDGFIASSCESLPVAKLPFSSKRVLEVGGWVEEGALKVRIGPHGPLNDYPIHSLPLKGIHNWENMLAALLSLEALGVDPQTLNSGLKTFRALPHRMEEVRRYRGVLYVNDSKSTNVGSVLKAFEGLGSPIIWIAGGRDKGLALDPLVPFVKQKVTRLISFGEARGRIGEFFKELVPTESVENLADAVKLASRQAREGATVLFSPACSSFDQFQDYQQRGEKFKEIVNGLQ